MADPELIPLLEADALERALRRMAAGIAENHPDLGKLAIIGIPTRGVYLANRLVDLIEDLENQRPLSGRVDISMHRDDYHSRPPAGPVMTNELPLPLEGKQLVLVDDVLYTGRTIRAALDALSTYGRPSRVQLAVLIDRGHRELPIQPDYVGTRITTAPQERIRVRLDALDDVPSDKVSLVRPHEEEPS